MNSNQLKTWLVFTFLGVIGLWFALTLFLLFNDGAVNNTGSFGDSFGILNALFSGLAFAVIAISLIVQHRDVNSSIKAMEAANKHSSTIKQIQALNAIGNLEDKVERIQSKLDPDVMRRLEFRRSDDRELYRSARVRKITRLRELIKTLNNYIDLDPEDMPDEAD